MQLVVNESGVGTTIAHVSLLELEERSANGGPVIAVLRWPDDRDLVDELRRSQRPRLLVVGPHDDPVAPHDDLEDWIRLPVDDRDVRARLARLWDHFAAMPIRPVLDGYGRLLFGETWIGLSVVEERLVRALVDRFGRVVTYGELLDAGWPGQHKDKAILRPRISVLRRRLQPMRLEIRSVREVGHVLEATGRSAVIDLREVSRI